MRRYSPVARLIRPFCTSIAQRTARPAALDEGYSGSASKRPASANLSASARVEIPHNQPTRNCGSSLKFALGQGASFREASSQGKRYRLKQIVCAGLGRLCTALA